MKLEIDEKIVAENATAELLEDLDFSQNISLIAGESQFLQWWVEDDGAVSINFREGADQEPMTTDLADGFSPEEIINAFKNFLANDNAWTRNFEWSPHSELGPITREDQWHASVVLVDETTPATVLCNIGISEVIDQIPVTQFVMFGLPLQNPDENGLSTDEESEFCDAIESEIAQFSEDQGGVAVGEVTLEGIRRFYTYNDAPEAAFESFLERIATEYDCELFCEIYDDPEKMRYWADLYPDSDDDFEEELEDENVRVDDSDAE